MKNNGRSDQPEKLVAFVLPIEQDCSRGDSVKTEFGKTKAPP